MAEASAPAVVPAQQPAAAIEADENDDSGYDANTIASSTTSIGSSVLNFRKENGRTYHAYKDGTYPYPNDEVEADRLDMQHHEMQLLLDGKLFTAEIPEGKVLHRVLDIGTGTGIWAIDFADDHPESSVLGIDLSPIQPAFLPPNVQFEIDDVEANWTFSEKFDFIYSRMMFGSVVDYPKLFRQSFENLNPGGFMEIFDPAWPLLLNDGEKPKDSALFKWLELLSEGFKMMNRDTNAARLYKDQMIAAGFVNVTEKIFIVPTNTWPKDKKLKEIGMWQCENVAGPSGGLEAASTAVFTRLLGWTKEELDAFLPKVRTEHRDRRIHAYFEYIVVVGQKPEKI